MGERHTHTAAAATNLRLAGKLESAGSSYLVWVPTLLFYVAVQMVEARLADDNLHIAEHGNREAELYRLGSSPAGISAYRDLKRMSCDWRYHAKEPTPGDLVTARRRAEDLAGAISETWPPA